jgi:DNA-binding transcriptional MerR regulator
MEENRTYSIGTVARKVGVPKYKLRQWCDRYLPEIQKIDIADMQHRRFTDRDVELIKKIKAFRERGFTLEAAIETARKDLLGEDDRITSVPSQSDREAKQE